MIRFNHLKNNLEISIEVQEGFREIMPKLYVSTNDARNHIENYPRRVDT